MRKHIKPSLSLLLLLTVIIGLIPINIKDVPVEAATTSTRGVTVADVKNIIQTFDNTDALNEFFQRILTGSLTLEWPHPQNFVDIVVIQDFSVSFKGSIIANVGKAVEKIADELTGLITGPDENGSKFILNIPTDILSNYRGNYIEITINANIDKAANITPYLEKGIEKTASLSTGNGNDLTAEAIVIPPSGNEPKINKTVNHIGENGEAVGTTDKKLVLDNADEEYQYRINLVIPGNTAGYEKIGIEDILDPVLVPIVDKEKLKPVVLLGDKPAEGVREPVVSGNTVSFEMTEGFERFAGKTLTLIINAKIGDISKLSDSKLHPNLEIPNRASIEFNGGEKDWSNTVSVTPPTFEPTIDKSVKSNETDETRDILKLAERTTPFVYQVKTDIPQSTAGFTNITITDTLEPVLQLTGDKYDVITRDSEGNEVTDPELTAKVETDGRKFKLEITEGFEKYAGKQIILRISAEIIPGADLKEYTVGLIPNQAFLDFNNDGKTRESNKVYVVPPSDPVTPPEDTPSISLVKTADTLLVTAAGQKITYSFTVINTGNTVLDEIKLTDTMNNTSQEVSITKDGVVVTTLEPGESAVGTLEYFTTVEDIGKEIIHNDAVVIGVSPKKTTVESKDSHDIPTAEQPVIDLDKRADKKVVTEEGELVTYELTITNIGRVKLSDITLNDTMLGGNITLPNTELEPGESMSLSVPHNITAGEFSMFEIRNDADVEGTSPVGKKVTDKDYWTVIPKKEIKASFEMLKFDGAANTPLAGAKFQLANFRNEVIAESITDAEGKILFADIPAGVYLLVEAEAPAGYLLNESRQIVAVLPDGSVMTNGKAGGPAIPDFKDIPETGTIILHKMDAADIRISLPDARFELWKRPAASSETKADTDSNVQPGTEPVNSDVNAMIESYNADVEHVEQLQSLQVEKHNEINEINQILNSETDLSVEGIPETEVQNNNSSELQGKIAQLESEIAALQAENQKLLENMAVLKGEIEAAQQSKPEAVEGTEAIYAADAPADGFVKAGEYTTNEFGIIRLNGLEDGEYYFREIEAPAGYRFEDIKYNFVVKNGKSNEIIIKAYNTEENPDPRYTDITVTKIWEDKTDIKPDIMIVLINNKTKEVIKQAVIKSGGNTAVFEGLPITGLNGEAIEYAAVEYDVKGYKSVVVVGDNNAVTITNTEIPEEPKTETIDRIINKKWVDGPEPKPAVTMELFANGIKIGEGIIEPGSKSIVFKDLPVSDAYGEIRYTFIEVVPEGYEEIQHDDDTFVSVNKLKVPPGGKTSVTVTKTWLENSLLAYIGSKPQIILRLHAVYADGSTEEVRNQVFAEGKTSHTWTDLDIMDKNGKSITYMITEDAVGGFSSLSATADGVNFNVLNIKKCDPPPKTPCVLCVIDPECKICEPTPPTSSTTATKPTKIPTTKPSGGLGGVPNAPSPSPIGGASVSSATGKGNLPGTGNTTATVPIIGGISVLVAGIFFLLKKGRK